MSHKLRNTIIILVSTPIILLAGIWFFIVKPSAEEKLNSALSSSSTTVSGGPFKVFFLGATAPSTLTVNTKPIPIPLEQTSLDISAISLLMLTPKLRLTSELFGGRIQGSVSYKLSDQSVIGEISADGVQVAKYQLASMLGITDGKFNLSVTGRGSGTNFLLPSKMFFMLKGLKKPKASKVPSWISPIAINIPAIESADLTAEAICSPAECKSSKFSLSSSLGQASGSFSFPLEGNKEPQANITVALTQAGKSELLPYFGLLNQELLSVPEKPFIIRLTWQNHKPKLSVVPISDSL